ncbi:BaiN/RdsA family NAD(P)/FAD-dependent oxidoreductase [Aquirufa salirivi]|uniref:NAD(P)/FAD-dependent oxidoreductase n=1 Tax=Aquirufa salirivi TaxID=3104729 RepID=A0ABW8RZC6_9BACT
MSKELRISIIGGGAAGFFAAISAKQHHPEAQVQILEKTSHFLAKVKISGGGRCNVCHAEFNNRKLAEHYPRGEKFLKKAFEQFDATSTMEWFEQRLVALKTYPDGCVFPLSNTSQSIIDCFLREAKKLDIELLLHHSIESIEIQEKGGFMLKTKDKTIDTDRVIITTGGQPKLSGLHWLEALGHSVIPPMPSLFTFNMPEEPIKEFMGLVVEKATVRIEGQKLVGKGPLLITHWGMSGPAILQLSAWGARILAEVNYQFAILINWLDETKESELREKLDLTRKLHGGKMISNHCPFPIPARLWNFLLSKNEIILSSRWIDVNPKQINKLVNTLLNDRYQVQGKTTFKEEFVTAGGIDLAEIHVQNMESKRVPGLFFAGEIMDIDGITGGFNFQAAWTTGYIAGKNAAE